MVRPDGVARSLMVSVSPSVNLPLHHKVQKFSSGTGSPGGPGKRAVKRIVLWVCGVHLTCHTIMLIGNTTAQIMVIHPVIT